MFITVDASKLSHKVRLGIARETNDSETLAILAKDSDIREAVAGNVNTSKEMLDKLSQDGNWRVLVAVARNVNTSKDN